MNFQLVIRSTVILILLKSVVVYAKENNNFEQPFQSYQNEEHVKEIKWIESKLQNKESKFLVKMRSTELQRNKCELCHNGLNIENKEKSKTHDNIQLGHAVSQGMTCFTCHNAANVKTLKNPNNQEIIEIDHAYLSCQGCHFSQVKDWVGGAHGKRVTIWTQPRIVYNCTECHNPHAPQFGKRWPKIISTLPEGK